MTSVNDYSQSISVDLSSCEREPIQFLGHVQPFGALLTVTPDWIVTRVSANVEEHWQVPAEELIGTALSDHAQPSFMKTVTKNVRQLVDDDSMVRIFGAQLTIGGPLHDVALHASGGGIIIEVELHNQGSESDFANSVQAFVERLKYAKNIDAMMDLASRQMKLLTGFDRVMVYKLSNEGDGDGDVVAEACEDHLERFKGLRYPASDIPAQARKMYLRSLLRIISDINADSVPIIPALGADQQPLDLTLSTLRAVSPIHLEYLRNMGVEASMSVSIIRDGKLWGLFACHHYSPRILCYETRTAAELYGQIFSFILGEFQARKSRENETRFKQLNSQLMSRLADGNDLLGEFGTIADAVQSVIECDGVSLYIDGSYESRGASPNADCFAPLSRFLNTAAASEIYQTNNLSESAPEAKHVCPDVAGILAIPVSRSPRDYVVCYRKEVAQSVTWGGNPEKPVEFAPHGSRLLPRSSFAAWKQEVKDRSLPWGGDETHAAESLRVSLLEVVLKLTGNAAKEAKHAADRQDLLIAELNHRVRNILNLIRGLISQSTAPDEDVTTFSKKIGGRVYALARAHDLITKEQWAPASLREMVIAEIEAYSTVDNERLKFAGPDVLLAPSAFTAIALVIHEMVTNSAKYGALTDRRGHVEITTSITDNGDLVIKWQDIGGPAVQAPTRRGFGTTIIERSIPFELKGEAEIKYDVRGVKARFRVPAEYVSSSDKLTEPNDELAAVEPAAELSGHALIVEDSIIIAMDAEAMLQELGAETVHMASNVAEALRVLTAHPIKFALLDVNLGNETSTPVAHALIQTKCPFILATGYGDSGGMTDEFPNTPIIQKPIDQVIFRDVLSQTLSKN